MMIQQTVFKHQHLILLVLQYTYGFVYDGLVPKQTHNSISDIFPELRTLSQWGKLHTYGLLSEWTRSLCMRRSVWRTKARSQPCTSHLYRLSIYIKLASHADLVMTLDMKSQTSRSGVLFVAARILATIQLSERQQSNLHHVADCVFACVVWDADCRKMPSHSPDMCICTLADAACHESAYVRSNCSSSWRAFCTSDTGIDEHYLAFQKKALLWSVLEGLDRRVIHRLRLRFWFGI